MEIKKNHYEGYILTRTKLMYKHQEITVIYTIFNIFLLRERNSTKFQIIIRPILEIYLRKKCASVLSAVVVIVAGGVLIKCSYFSKTKQIDIIFYSL